MLKGHTLAPSSMVTSPITWAAMSTKAPGCTFGVRPGTERITGSDHLPGAQARGGGPRVAEPRQHRVSVGAEHGRGRAQDGGRARQLHRVAQHLPPPGLRV